jgi:hypothetical protein
MANGERGHVMVGVPSLAAAVGAIILGYGAAESDTMAIVGGWILGVGIFFTGVARHRGIDYDIYDRLEKMEGRQP